MRWSELFRRHFHRCFIDDRFGVEVCRRIGVERITWECDYPYSDWPKSRAHAAEVLAEVPDDEVHQIAELNARRFYHFPA